MLFTLSLHGHLPQKRRTFCKLAVQLIIQIDSIRHNHDGWAIQCLLQKMRIENH